MGRAQKGQPGAHDQRDAAVDEADRDRAVDAAVGGGIAGVTEDRHVVGRDVERAVWSATVLVGLAVAATVEQQVAAAQLDALAGQPQDPLDLDMGGIARVTNQHDLTTTGPTDREREHEVPLTECRCHRAAADTAQ